MLALSVASSAGCSLERLDDVSLAVSEAYTMLTNRGRLVGVESTFEVVDSHLAVALGPNPGGHRPQEGMPVDPLSSRVLSTTAETVDIDPVEWRVSFTVAV